MKELGKLLTKLKGDRDFLKHTGGGKNDAVPLKARMAPMGHCGYKRERTHGPHQTKDKGPCNYNVWAPLNGGIWAILMSGGTIRKLYGSI